MTRSRTRPQRQLTKSVITQVQLSKRRCLKDGKAGLRDDYEKDYLYAKVKEHEHVRTFHSCRGNALILLCERLSL